VVHLDYTIESETTSGNSNSETTNVTKGPAKVMYTFRLFSLNIEYKS